MRRPALLIIALCLIGILFGWKAQKAWFSPPPVIDSAKRPAIDLGPGELGPAPWRDLAGAAAAISSRSLFRPDRSFFGAGESGSGDGQGQNQDLSRLSMIGLMTFGGGMKGIVISNDNPQAERLELKAGDSLLGFKVKEVRMDGIVLISDERQVLLPLYAGPPTVGEGSLRSQNTGTYSNRAGVPEWQQQRADEDANAPGENQ